MKPEEIGTEEQTGEGNCECEEEEVSDTRNAICHSTTHLRVVATASPMI
jgi:hypothetical protein